MSLAEKKVLRDFKDQNWPAIEKRLKDNLGAEIEVNWDSYEIDGRASALPTGLASWEKFSKAVQEVCSDDLGKEALAEIVKKIVFDATDMQNISSPKSISVNNGVLTYCANPCQQMGLNEEGQVKEWVKRIEKLL